MSTLPDRSGPHDIGGDHAGAIERDGHGPAHWEKEADAIRMLLAEFGLALPDEVEIRVHDRTAENRHLVVPERPLGTEGWGEDRLGRLVSRDRMTGVAPARAPR